MCSFFFEILAAKNCADRLRYVFSFFQFFFLFSCFLMVFCIGFQQCLPFTCQKTFKYIYICIYIYSFCPSTFGGVFLYLWAGLGSLPFEPANNGIECAGLGKSVPFEPTKGSNGQAFSSPTSSKKTATPGPFC